jgi:hypothetical protein
MPSRHGQGQIYVPFCLLTSSVVLSSLKPTTVVASTKSNETGSVKIWCKLTGFKLCLHASDGINHVVLKVIHFWM